MMFIDTNRKIALSSDKAPKQDEGGDAVAIGFPAPDDDWYWGAWVEYWYEQP